MKMYYVNCGVYNTFMEEMLGLKARYPQFLFEVIIAVLLMLHIHAPFLQYVQSNSRFTVVAEEQREIYVNVMGTNLRLVRCNS